MRDYCPGGERFEVAPGRHVTRYVYICTVLRSDRRSGSRHCKYVGHLQNVFVPSHKTLLDQYNWVAL